jgi:hypothetical protein
MTTPRMHPHHVDSRPQASRWSQVGAGALVIQCMAVLFWIGVWYANSKVAEKNLEHIQIQHEFMLAELAAIKEWQKDHDKK